MQRIDEQQLVKYSSRRGFKNHYWESFNRVNTVDGYFFFK